MIRDEQLSSTLELVAAVCARVLDDPAALLGWAGQATAEGAAHESLLPRARHEVLHRILGPLHPGSAEWADLPAQERAQWWGVYVSRVLAVPAAAPHVFGALANRLPVQAALGASAQCLVVCAVAGEFGVTEPSEWVPLMGRVVFDRDLARPRADLPEVSLVKVPAESEPSAVAASLQAGEIQVPDDDDDPSLLRRGAGVLWTIAKVLVGMTSLFDERPRGKWRYRALGNLPIVGVVGGWLDERGGLAEAVRRTAALVGGND